MYLKPLLLLLGTLCALPLTAQKAHTLTSPDATLQATVTTGSDIRISLVSGQETLLAPSPVAMTLKDGLTLGRNPKLTKVRKSSADTQFASPFYKKSSVKDRYNELTLSFRGNYGLTVRLYDDGLAYRFTTTMPADVIYVEGEQVAFTFAADHTAIAPYVKRGKTGDFESQFFNSFENTYTKLPLTQLDPGRLIFLPMLVELPRGRKMVISEADLEGYPGLYLNATPDTPQLNGVFAPVPKTMVQGGHNNLQMQVTERENYIAATTGTRSFPWRILIVSDNDSQLLDNDMVYRLAPESKIADTSWIKPGKVAWDWWNAWNLHGVGFKSGINNETYKYYIWFASQHGLEYVILDEGWAVNKQADLMQVVPEIDLPELVAYGRKHNVDLILWAGYHAFDRDMEQVVKHYADMGIKGFKVDFMDRDDQPMVDFLHRAAEVCARHKMLLDYHGIFKPTGLNRTWPNVLNYEGVFGLEQMKWEPVSTDMVTYDVTMPFIRMIAGPVDYTQGAMRNVAKGNYRPVYSEAMSQGTRCRQLAEYVVFESPITMLCDSPSNYLKEPESIQFMAGVPTVWDETVALTGSVGEYIAIARRSGSTWYIGAMTDWSARELELDLSFLPEGDYDVESYADGVNADRAACDYIKEIDTLSADRKLKIRMAPGGGYAACLRLQ
ncbi:glycoside hydrolase family 97 protein [uncultured Alistipes sp.]|uniref:glycoside hydrolase family 97 protein n=1 Tax=uncultured Alistipes sp. TaxID=538949 RepID=UPI0025F3F020|nr:glycoside hydrolase family 97 protein [uncultured Alistipes sp.]